MLRSLFVLFALSGCFLVGACAQRDAEDVDGQSESAVRAHAAVCDAPNDRLFAAPTLSRWQGLRTDLGPRNLQIARWMAWLSAVAYVDDFGDLDDPGYVFRCGFFRLGFGAERSGRYDVSAGSAGRVAFDYANEGELWWNAGAKLKELVAACPRIDADTASCRMRDAIEKDLFTQLPPSRAIGKLHGQRLRGLGRFDQGTTQVFLLHDPEKSYAVVAFRGTQATVAEDVLADLNVLPTDSRGAKVHAGFQHALHEETARGRSAAAILLERLDHLPRGTQVYITGHSLGGALATLFARELLDRRDRPYTLRGLYTFGAPAAGDRAFAEALNDGLRRENAWHGRFTYGRDMVPASTYFITFRYVHNTEHDREAERHAEGVNLDCDGAGYSVTEARRSWYCSGPVADHGVDRYFSALSAIVERARTDDELTVAR